MALTNFPNGISVGGKIPPADATFTIGAEAGNVINVAIQLLDGAGAEMVSTSGVLFYLSNDSDGSSQKTAATSLAIGTDGLMIEWASNSSGLLVSEADGDIDINIGDISGAATYYLVLIMPTGAPKISGAITFA